MISAEQRQSLTSTKTFSWSILRRFSLLAEFLENNPRDKRGMTIQNWISHYMRAAFNLGKARQVRLSLEVLE
jgi:hypothetical protein